jgi:gamma-glutamylcyclotransferase (GGCT)/AIG2-like uncharacterized protein YtfP
MIGSSWVNMKLFVYGTLLSGMRLHETLADAHCLGPAIIRGNLLDLGAYAGLVEGDGVVTGEIYEVDRPLLERLDQVEGFRADDPAGSLYLRKDARARRFADGTTVDAAAYYFPRATHAENRIACGDFRRHDIEKNGGKAWVIAYGSNLSTERLARRLERFGPARAAERTATVLPGHLEGFRLSFNKRPQGGGPPYANIEFIGEGTRCPAVAWSLTAEEIVVLDQKEGATGTIGSTHYYRIGMPFFSDDRIVIAHAFVANPDWIQEPAPPSPEYLGHLRAGYREHGLDTLHLEDALARAGSSLAGGSGSA